MMNPFHHKFYPNRLSSVDGGEYNGYVAFDKELPPSWQGSGSFDSDNVLDRLVHVHGGITFDNSMSALTDCPIIPLTEIPNPEILKNFRCIGFDTLHCDDTKERWTLEATKEEALNLMKQIEALCDK